ncbi:MAG: chromate resistance protein [Acidobacteriia bacterium]|nr:chromate resistance protein [Terriglobia bacterium]
MSSQGASPRWLLFAFQLPTHPSNARVKTWRRLQQIGAVPTRNAVYVLPNTDQCREDFAWLRAEIGTMGGAATVFAADALDREGEEDIVTTFQQARDADYRALTRDADRLLASAKGKAGRAARTTLPRSIRALRERFAQIERIDFHQAGTRQHAAESLAALEHLAARARPRPPSGDAPVRAIKSVRGRRWATRPRPGIDRMASAWLIRRFIDPRAKFAFVDRPSKADVPFDMYSGEFSHHGGLCTFEVLCERFGIADPAVTRIAHIVHDLDLKEMKYASPDAPAVGRMVEGLRAVHADDHALLEQGIGMFEALARSFEGIDEKEPRRTRRTRRKNPGRNGS